MVYQPGQEHAGDHIAFQAVEEMRLRFGGGHLRLGEELQHIVRGLPVPRLASYPNSSILGLVPNDVPPFLLRGCWRQDKLPVQLPGIHLLLFQKLDYLSLTHRQALPDPITG